MTLLIVARLGGSLFRGGRIYLFGLSQIDSETSIKNRLSNRPFSLAVKLATKGLRLLNIVALHNTLKGVQTALIYTDIHTFWG